MPATVDALKRLLVALLVGLLIGVDRERAEQRKQRKLFAGVRTFPLIALLGAILALMLAEIGPWPLVVGLMAVAAIALVSYRESVRAGETGATTEVAALATYALGTMAGVGQLAVAGATAVSVAVLLAAKPRLERFSRAISETELAAVLELAVISAIVLPLLPDRGYGPWQVLNPFRIWMLVVMVSAVSFAGFIAVRWRGESAGPLWAAGLGGLVSSTATTVAMAARSRVSPQQVSSLSAAAVLASTVMCGRLAVLVAVVGPGLLPRIGPAMAAMALTGLLATLVLYRAGPHHEGSSSRSVVENPFRLRSALLFGAIFAATMLLVRGSRQVLGTTGTLLAAGLSGLADVDAISIALARGEQSDRLDQASLGVIIASASNNLFKATVAMVNGAGRFRHQVPLALLAISTVGVVVAVLTATLF
jgi:uncharacterized membrane protein (DUF4010 family)